MRESDACCRMWCDEDGRVAVPVPPPPNRPSGRMSGREMPPGKQAGEVFACNTGAYPELSGMCGRDAGCGSTKYSGSGFLLAGRERHVSKFPAQETHGRSF